MRRREASPTELVDAALERVERLDASVGAFVTVDADRARDAAQGGRAGRPRRRRAVGPAPAAGRPDGGQGPRPDPGDPDDARLGGLRGPGPAGRGRRPAADARGGDGQPRQVEHPGAGAALLHRARRRAAGPHPLGPLARGRRVLRRGGRRRRRRAGRRRSGLRRWRLDPHPGERVRAGRAEAVAGPREPRARRRRLVGAGLPRPARPRRARRRGAARRARRAAGGRPLVGAAAVVVVPRGLRPGDRASCASAAWSSRRCRMSRSTPTAWPRSTTPRRCWTRSATSSRTSPTPGRPTRRKRFATLWDVVACGAPVPPEREHLLRPLTRYLRERGQQVTGPQLGATLTGMQHLARTVKEAQVAYDVILSPTLAQPPLPGRARCATTTTRPPTSPRSSASPPSPPSSTSPGSRRSACRPGGREAGVPGQGRRMFLPVSRSA